MNGAAAFGRHCHEPIAVRRTRDSLPLGSPPVAAALSLAMLSVPQIPRILHARATRTGATRHHTLLKGTKGAGQAVVATAAAVLHAPWPVDFGGSRAGIDRSKGCDRKQDESGADHDHGYPPIRAARRSNTQQDPLFQTKPPQEGRGCRERICGVSERISGSE
jgi:hypothetical protein